MTIEKRLERLEERAPALNAQGGVVDYLLGVVDAVYEGADEADQARRIAALGLSLEPVNAMESAMVMQLNKAYGN